MEQKLIELQEKIDELNDEIKDLKDEIDELKDEISDYETAMEDKDEEIESLGSGELRFQILTEQMKYDFFIENFDKINLEQLENLVK